MDESIFNSIKPEDIKALVKEVTNDETGYNRKSN